VGRQELLELRGSTGCQELEAQLDGVPEGWSALPGCSDVHLKILPLWLELAIRPLHLELISLSWNGWPDCVGASEEWTRRLHQTGSSVSIGLLSRERQLPLTIPLNFCLLALNDDRFVDKLLEVVVVYVQELELYVVVEPVKGMGPSSYHPC